MSKVFEQCLLCAAVQNMKKIALVVDKKELLLLWQLLKGLNSTIQAVFLSTGELLEKVWQIIYKDINLFTKENPA